MNTDKKQLELLYEEVSNKQENYHYPGETTESAIEKYIKNGSKLHLYLPGTLDLKSLPSTLKLVGRNLILSNCINLESLPDNLTVMGNLNLLRCEKLKSLPTNLKVGGCLNLEHSGIKRLEQLPDDLRVVGPIRMNGFSEEDISKYQSMRRKVRQMEDKLPELKDIF